MDVGLIEQLNDIGIALTIEKDIDLLLEKILRGAKSITNADAGTLYSITRGRQLKFEIVLNDTLKLYMGGSTGRPVRLPNISLYDADTGKANTHMVAVRAVVSNVTINIPDVYGPNESFDFSGPREFDRKFGYQSQSFLAVPLTNTEDEVVGVFQLINARDRETGEVIPFSPEHEQLVESLASQAAVALARHRLASDKSKTTIPIIVHGKHSEEDVVFSRSRLSSQLEACSLSVEAAEDISLKVYGRMVEKGISEIRAERLQQLVQETLRAELGGEAARRFQVWNLFRQSGRPLFVLIGGATGSGKSTVASELALRLGIERIYSTDTLREVLRLMVAEPFAPALHTSCYVAWKTLLEGHGAPDVPSRQLLIDGYKAQTRNVSVAIDGVIRRSIEEGVSSVLEGIHLYPSYRQRIPADSNPIVVPVVLAVPDRRRFHKHFERRALEAPSRSKEKYLENVDAIWELQSFFLEEAQRCRVPVIPNIRRTNTIRQVLNVVTEALEREFSPGDRRLSNVS